MRRSAEQRRETKQTDPAAWVSLYGDRLFRHALLRAGSREVAEDLVQETFLAAVRGRERFRSDSSELTWLISILHRKIADHFRSHYSKPHAISEPDAIETCQTGSSRAWRIDPRRIAEDREFWEVFGECVRELPPTLAEAYTLREIEGESPKNVCEILRISPTNLSMRVQRARLAMRAMLEQRWFSSGNRGGRVPDK